MVVMRRREKMAATEIFIFLWREVMREESGPCGDFSGSWADGVSRNDHRGKMYFLNKGTKILKGSRKQWMAQQFHILNIR